MNKSSLTIGINNLTPSYGSIEKNGLFIITTPTFNFSKSILVQTILNNPTTKTALISFKEKNELFSVSPEINKKLLKIYQSDNLLLKFVLKNQHKDLFANLLQDTSDKDFESIDLILIDTYQDNFTLMPIDQLAITISSWQNWLVLHKKKCIWVIHGDHASQLIKNKTSTLNNLFNGLSSIEFNSMTITYDLLFWHLSSSIQTSISSNITLDEIKHEIYADDNRKSFEKHSISLSISQDNRVLVMKDEPDEKEIFPREWEMVRSIEKLEEEISYNSNATAIIYLHPNTDIKLLATKILEIRKKGNRQLKIVLKESERYLRNNEEKLFIEAGANLIIPNNVTFLKFVTMVHAVQGSYYLRDIPDSIKADDINDLNGFSQKFLPPTEFGKKVISSLKISQNKRINSSLLKFVINKAIPIEEITSLIDIKRNGDFFTLTEEYLYMFLFQCEASEIKNALAHIFSLPVEDLFFAQEFFSYYDEINSELIFLSSPERRKSLYELDNNQQLQLENNTVRDYKKIIRHSAQPTPFVLTI